MSLLTGWRRIIGCHIFIGHLSQKSPVISGSSEANDLQLHPMIRHHPVRHLLHMYVTSSIYHLYVIPMSPAIHRRTSILTDTIVHTLHSHTEFFTHSPPPTRTHITTFRHTTCISYVCHLQFFDAALPKFNFF